ncbi:hypothetical protein PR048_027104 [Dryococelus australis]|uniref:Tc1-like transposase DDE domain-containing protein n=1 Tax=Dryococelus australis TaxID=614101 RepID=A0ABQ9GEI5_9NEOP|nr:hypothetical protein PR048_027104 [Dryococelus australis]
MQQPMESDAGSGTYGTVKFILIPNNNANLYHSSLPDHSFVKHELNFVEGARVEILLDFCSCNDGVEGRGQTNLLPNVVRLHSVHFAEGTFNHSRCTPRFTVVTPAQFTPAVDVWLLPSSPRPLSTCFNDRTAEPASHPFRILSSPVLNVDAGCPPNLETIIQIYNPAVVVFLSSPPLREGGGLAWEGRRRHFHLKGKNSRCLFVAQVGKLLRRKVFFLFRLPEEGKKKAVQREGLNSTACLNTPSHTSCDQDNSHCPNPGKQESSLPARELGHDALCDADMRVMQGGGRDGRPSDVGRDGRPKKLLRRPPGAAGRELSSQLCEPDSITGGSLPDIRTWESCRTMTLVCGFPRGSPISPPLSHSGVATCSPNFNLIGYKDLDARGTLGTEIFLRLVEVYGPDVVSALNGAAIVSGVPRWACECELIQRDRRLTVHLVTTEVMCQPTRLSMSSFSIRKCHRGEYLATSHQSTSHKEWERAYSICCATKQREMLFSYDIPRSKDVQKWSVSEELWAAFNIENLRADEVEVSNGIVRHDSHLRKSEVNRLGIEPGSPWWEASRQTAYPPLPLKSKKPFQQASPELTPRDLNLFPALEKKLLGGYHFFAQDDFEAAVPNTRTFTLSGGNLTVWDTDNLEQGKQKSDSFLKKKNSGHAEKKARNSVPYSNTLPGQHVLPPCDEPTSICIHIGGGKERDEEKKKCEQQEIKDGWIKIMARSFGDKSGTKIVNGSRASVVKVYREWMKITIGNNRHGNCGAPRAIEVRNERRLRRCVMANRQAIAVQMNQRASRQVSTATVQRTLLRMRRRSRWRTTAPMLTQPSPTSHVFSCIEGMEFTVFREKLRRTDTLQPLLDEHKAMGAVLWSGECSRGINSLCPIIRVEGTLDRFGYESILGDHARPYMMIVYPREDGIFQQDNAPCQKAGSVHTWLEEHNQDVKVLPWPPNSPYLNPFEHLWDHLDRRVRRLSPPPHTFQQLRDALQTAWLQIPAIST